MRVLLVDSDPVSAAHLGDYLELVGSCVDYAANASLAGRLADSLEFDAIVLVSRMPTLDGAEACRNLCETLRRAPALFVIGEEASVTATVAAFDAGADCYLARPVNLSELHARLKVLLRSRRKLRGSSRLEWADLELDTRTTKAWRQGVALALSPVESMLLHMLMEAAPRVLTYAELETRLWGADRGRQAGAANLRTHVHNLRRKVDRPFPVKLIRTRHHFGYHLVAP